MLYKLAPDCNTCLVASHVHKGVRVEGGGGGHKNCLALLCSHCKLECTFRSHLLHATTQGQGLSPILYLEEHLEPVNWRCACPADGACYSCMHNNAVDTWAREQSWDSAKAGCLDVLTQVCNRPPASISL